jgi:hypothetical protein
MAAVAILDSVQILFPVEREIVSHLGFGLNINFGGTGDCQQPAFQI